MKTLQIPKNKPFSEMDFNLFESYEQKFLIFLHYLDKPNQPFITIPKDLAFRIEKQANFFEKGQKGLRNIIYEFLTRKPEEKPEKTEEKPEETEEKSEKTEEKSDEKSEKSESKAQRRLRAYSYTKYDYNKIFHYRYFSAYLKRLKKKVNFLIFSILR